MSDEHQCGFVGGAPCPNPKKCVFPRCDIEYSGSPVWAALKRVVTWVEPPPQPIIKEPPKPVLPDETFD